MISTGEELVSLVDVVENELVFTKQYLDIMKSVPGSARKLASHLITGWEKQDAKTLDYFGPDEIEDDVYSGVDGEPMDVCEITPFRLSFNNSFIEGLSADWFRDVMRYRLVGLKLPKRILVEYLQMLKKNY